MSEIKREPITIVIDGEVYHAFDERHSGNDIVRYLVDQCTLDDAKYLIENYDD